MTIYVNTFWGPKAVNKEHYLDSITEHSEFHTPGSPTSHPHLLTKSTPIGWPKKDHERRSCKPIEVARKNHFYRFNWLSTANYQFLGKPLVLGLHYLLLSMDHSIHSEDWLEHVGTPHHSRVYMYSEPFWRQDVNVHSLTPETPRYLLCLRHLHRRYGSWSGTEIKRYCILSRYHGVSGSNLLFLLMISYVFPFWRIAVPQMSFVQI